MLTIAVLLLIPLGVRYLTSWHMNQLRLRLLREDDALRALAERHVAVREELLARRRRLRQYETRKTFLGNDIHQERKRLEELRARRTGAGRLAA